MKKLSIVVSFFVILSFFALPSFGQAQNVSDFQRSQLASLLEDLKKQISGMQAKLQVLLKAREAEKTTSQTPLTGSSAISEPTPAVLPVQQAPTESATTADSYVSLSEVPGEPRVSCRLPTLERGLKINSVYLLQMVLSKAGYYPDGLITGYFGGLTEAAVKRFQTSNGLSATGKIDNGASLKLDSLIKKHILGCVYETSGLKITSPASNNALVYPSFQVTGYGSGQWGNNQGSIGTVTLYDGNGGNLHEAQLKVTSPFGSTPAYFVATLSFVNPSTSDGKLVFRNSNASGLPENSRTFTMPVRFNNYAPPSTPTSTPYQ